MKRLRVQPLAVRAIKVKQNTQLGTSHQWSQVLDAKTGEVLHTGQTGYIKRVVRTKYNQVIS
jgi:hypothetical protein